MIWKKIKGKAYCTARKREESSNEYKALKILRA